MEEVFVVFIYLLKFFINILKPILRVCEAFGGA